MKLIDLIKENQNMPIYIYREMQDGIDDFAYFPIGKCNAEIKELTYYNGQYLDKEGYKEKFLYDLEDEEAFCELSKQELEQVCERLMRNAGYIKAIVIYEADKR